MRSPAFPSLDGLVGLARNDGVDIRPTLLRVLTDLYVQKPSHTPEEERHYTELALRLIEAVDIPVRASVAARLARHGGAPLAVLRRLARDTLDVARPILEQSTRLSHSDLFGIAQELGASHSAVIASRPEFAAEEAPSLAPTSQPAAATHYDEPPIALQSVTLSPAEELNELFFAAEPAERRMILLNLDYANLPPATAIPPSVAQETTRKLEIAALQRGLDVFTQELERTLAISRALARRVIEDLSGEPVVVAAKALQMPAPMLQRILLFLNPVVGQSVKRVYTLAMLYDEMTPSAALRMLTIWHATHPQKAHGLHQGYLWHDTRAERPASARRVAAQPQPARQRGQS